MKTKSFRTKLHHFRRILHSFQKEHMVSFDQSENLSLLYVYFLSVSSAGYSHFTLQFSHCGYSHNYLHYCQCFPLSALNHAMRKAIWKDTDWKQLDIPPACPRTQTFLFRSPVRSISEIKIKASFYGVC